MNTYVAHREKIGDQLLVKTARDERSPKVNTKIMGYTVSEEILKQSFCPKIPVTTVLITLSIIAGICSECSSELGYQSQTLYL